MFRDAFDCFEGKPFTKDAAVKETRAAIKQLFNIEGEANPYNQQRQPGLWELTNVAIGILQDGRKEGRVRPLWYGTRKKPGLKQMLTKYAQLVESQEAKAIKFEQGKLMHHPRRGNQWLEIPTDSDRLKYLTF
jgi:hypothetical protein